MPADHNGVIGHANSGTSIVCAEAGGVEGTQKKKVLDDFNAAFKKKFGVPVQIYAPYAYDTVMVMVQAMKRAGSAEPAKYLPALAATDGYEGVTGTIGSTPRATSGTVRSRSSPSGAGSARRLRAALNLRDKTSAACASTASPRRGRPAPAGLPCARSTDRPG